jgi:F0F1-type ATP synthase gamma subunit
VGAIVFGSDQGLVNGGVRRKDAGNVATREENLGQSSIDEELFDVISGFNALAQK